MVKKSFNIIGIKNLEGLEIIELHPSIISRNDHYNLIINFTVYNDADMERSLPLVKLEIYDDNDAVHSYWIDLNKNHLSPNEYYKFEYKVNKHFALVLHAFSKSALYLKNILNSTLVLRAFSKSAFLKAHF